MNICKFSTCQKREGKADSKGEIPQAAHYNSLQNKCYNELRNHCNSVWSLLTSSSATIAIFGGNSSSANDPGAKQLGLTYTGGGPPERDRWCHNPKQPQSSEWTETGIRKRELQSSLANSLFQYVLFRKCSRLLSAQRKKVSILFIFTFLQPNRKRKYSELTPRAYWDL